MIKRSIQFVRSLTPMRFLSGSKYVGAGAIIFDPDGKVLLLHNRLRRAWEYPVGGSKGPESPIETCRREVGEEAGLHIDKYRLVGIDFWQQLTPNGNLLFTFVAEISHDKAAEVKIQALEITDYRWCSRDEAIAIINPKYKARFVELLAAYDADKPVYLHTGMPVA